VGLPGDLYQGEGGDLEPALFFPVEKMKVYIETERRKKCATRRLYSGFAGGGNERTCSPRGHLSFIARGGKRGRKKEIETKRTSVGQLTSLDQSLAGEKGKKKKGGGEKEKDRPPANDITIPSFLSSGVNPLLGHGKRKGRKKKKKRTRSGNIKILYVPVLLSTAMSSEGKKGGEGEKKKGNKPRPPPGCRICRSTCLFGGKKERGKEGKGEESRIHVASRKGRGREKEVCASAAAVVPL